MAAITAASVKAFIRPGVPSGKTHSSLRDGSGLVLRLLPTGVATWYFVGRLPGAGRAGSQRMIRIGRWPDVSIATAREMTAEFRAKIIRGIDPVVERREKARQTKLGLPVALADYEAWLRSRKLTKVDMTMASLRRGFGPLMRRNLETIDKPAMVAAIEKIECDGFPGAAAHFRKVASSFFTRQIALDVIKTSPLAGYRRPRASRDAIADAESAGRALRPDEIVKVWNAAVAMNDTFGGIVRMILSTGIRRNEAANLRWDWIDRQAGTITIPARAMKAGSEHIVIISDLVARLLDETPNRAGGLLFPGRRLGATRPFNGWGKSLTRLREMSGIQGIGLHDLRRTFRSVLADLDVPEPVAELMLAHKRNDLVRRYNRSDLLRQRREAATIYDVWLSGLLGPDDDDVGNVVRLPR